MPDTEGELTLIYNPDVEDSEEVRRFIRVVWPKIRVNQVHWSGLAQSELHLQGEGRVIYGDEKIMEYLGTLL
jgi:hypothetical protein